VLLERLARSLRCGSCLLVLVVLPLVEPATRTLWSSRKKEENLFLVSRAKGFERHLQFRRQDGRQGQRGLAPLVLGLAAQPQG